MIYQFRLKQDDGFLGNKTTEDYFSEEFDELGDDGWELVQILYDPENVSSDSIWDSKTAVFKRPKS